ncbi:MAG: succinate dehydrogenase cytochrome b subunit [Gemmatimonadales bacterium]|nr:MAG: succinate dehydrogenase cytochrome b subunit [Gemmatimonadales bacterium]
MGRSVALFRTSIGLKITMAVSGIVFVGFVIGHMLGNLKLYLGAEVFNHYADGLREFGGPFLGHGQALWIARAFLIVALVVHVWSALKLTRQNHAARDVKYRKRESMEFSRASRSMRWGGVALLAFIIYHLLHLTFGSIHPDFIPGDAYHNVVAGFLSVPVSGVYMLAMIALGLHLYHGIWSAFQTLGISGPRVNRWRRPLALGIALFVVVGNLSFPVSVLTGILV